MATETICSVAGCGKLHHARGYCRKHYSQIHRWGEIRPDEGERQSDENCAATCSVIGCGKRMLAKGYCRHHYGQIWRNGEIRSDEEERQVVEKPISLHNSDRIHALERELRRAEEIYRNVIGFESRLKWRREIDEVKKDMARHGIAPPAPASLSIGAP